MTRANGRRKRQRGSIDSLPSGALRVRVYAGTDPVTKKPHYLTEVIEAGSKATSEAEKVRTRLLNQVDERRNPRTSATVNQLLDKYFDVVELGERTRKNYLGYARNHIRPLIGETKVGVVDADILDSLYAELRRCRRHCDPRARRRLVDHRTPRSHRCDERCRAHECTPLAAATIRQVHFILSGAFRKAARWRWVAASPVSDAEPPAAPTPDPRPPTAAEAARIVNAAWRDPDWGTLVWLAMTTGARRGELCALRWRHVERNTGTLSLRRSIAQIGTVTTDKDTKTHQQRRVALDEDTIAVLAEHHDRYAARGTALGLEPDDDAFVFSTAPDHSTCLVPDAVSQRYRKLVARLGIATTLHKLRHYSATELIAGGVDVRTVAGRLGHSGGGATTLRVYAAWISEADQRAATGLRTRMPERPTAQTVAERAKADPQSPYETIAATFARGFSTARSPEICPRALDPRLRHVLTTHKCIPHDQKLHRSFYRPWPECVTKRDRSVTHHSFSARPSRRCAE